MDEDEDEDMAEAEDSCEADEFLLWGATNCSYCVCSP